MEQLCPPYSATYDYDPENRPKRLSTSSHSRSVKKSFKIGAKTLAEPLVNVEQVKSYLSLLRAFKLLRSSVQESTDTNYHQNSVAGQLSKEKRWIWFVGCSVERCVATLEFA